MKSRALLNGTSIIIKETPENVLVLLAMRGFSPDTETASIFILDLPGYRTVRNKMVLFSMLLSL